MLTLLCIFLWSHSLSGQICHNFIPYRGNIIDHYNERGLLIKNLKSLDFRSSFSLSDGSYTLHSYRNYKKNCPPIGQFDQLTIVKDNFSQEPSFIIGTNNHVFRINGTDLSITDLDCNGPELNNPDFKVKNKYNEITMIGYESKPHPSIISCESAYEILCSFHNYNRLKIRIIL